MMPMTRRRLLQLTGAASAMLPVGVGRADAADITQDLDILRSALEIHPGALRYLNPAALDTAFDHLAAEFSATDALDARYLALSRFLSKLRCGHSYANFFNQSKAIRAALFDRPTRLPFAFRWIDGDMVVTGAGPGVDMPPGTIVTGINTIQPGDMLRTLLPYTRADGSAFTKRKALLEVQHRSAIEYFDVFHGLIYGVPEGGTHRIDARVPDGRQIQLSAPAMTLAGRRAMRDATLSDPQGNDLRWTFVVRDGVGVLTMPGWSTFKTDWEWQTWLDARLDEARDLRGLIIDNRRNEGGDISVGVRILSRLIAEPVALPGIRRLVRFRRFPTALRPHAATWDPSFYEVGKDAEPVGFGFYELPMAPEAMRLMPRGQTITTPTVLLTSPTNSSATFTFAQIAQASGRMTLVGEETGGNRRGINGDGFFFTTLPVSGIEFDLPMVGQYPSTPQPDQGILPDIQVSDTAAHIAAGRDVTLERALALL